MNDSAGTTATEMQINQTFIAWFRASSPYIHAFRNRTFVITFGGEVLLDQNFPHLIHDLALLSSLGIRLVIIAGTRPQIEQRMRDRNINLQFANGIRVTDQRTLLCVKEAAGAVRVEIEALLSMGLTNSPMAGARIRVSSGNFVSAKPLGVRNGVDYQHTGEVRRVDHDAITRRLDDGNIVLLSPIGYSPTGEIFNLTALEVAVATARAIKADKLICLTESGAIHRSGGDVTRYLSLPEAEHLLGQAGLDEDSYAHLTAAVDACRGEVRRTHLVDRHTDGGLLLELFTRDGIGTMVSRDIYEGTRQATIDDVGGILELITPLEQHGILVRRSREQLELEIGRFYVIDRDGTIIACAAFYPFAEEQSGELACLAVHSDYQRSGRGDALLNYVEKSAKTSGIRKLFVLTTHAQHWFIERGFVEVDRSALPAQRRAYYNLQRNSKVLLKTLDG